MASDVLGILLINRIFVDNYVPQWDDASKSIWEKPNATKHTALDIVEEDQSDLPYPQFRQFKDQVEKILTKQETTFPATEAESGGSYQPPPESIRGPPVYPPARQALYRPN